MFDSATIGIIGGADGPTAIFVTGESAFFAWLAGLSLVIAGLFFRVGR